MAEFRPIPVDRPPPRSWLPALGSVVAISLALAIVKPWEGATAPGPASSAGAPRSAAPAPTTSPERNEYDPRLFGTREPDPAWELWPAGYVVEFGIAGPLTLSGEDGPSSTGDPGASSKPGPATHEPAAGTAAPPGPASPVPSPGPGDGTVVDLGPADHLIALGINTPTSVRVDEVILWLHRGEDCCLEAIPVIRLPTPWESGHFLVIGVADPARPGEPGEWLIGEYRLDLVDETGETYSIGLRVTAPLG